MMSRVKAMLFAAVAVTAAALAVPAMAQFGGNTRPEVPLPAGEIRDVLLDNCVSCHGIDDYGFFAGDRERWREILNEKHDASAIEMAEKDKEILLDYLVADFGPETIPFPRDYVPEEITEFFTNADGRVFLEARCTACHSVDVVLEQRHDMEEWRQILVAERERIRNDPSFGEFRGLEGFSDENLEKLAEWLGRVRGINPFE